MHLIHSLGGGGAERQLSYLAPCLGQLGAEVHVAYVREGRNIERLKDSSCQLHRLHTYGNYDPRLYLSVASLVRDIRPALIQTWLPQMNVLGGVAAIRQNIPFVLSERNTGIAHENDLKSLARRWVGNRAAAIVSNSSQGLEYWADADPSVNKVVIPNALPTAELEQFREIKGSARRQVGEPLLILFAGRYVPAKRVFLVLDAFVEVVRRRADVVARMFGEGWKEDELRKRHSKSGVTDRVFVNSYTDDIWQWMADASVLVSLSEFEGQPNTVLEAAALGCPLLLSDIPAHRELIGDNGACYVGDFTAAAVADAVFSTTSRLPRGVQ